MQRAELAGAAYSSTESSAIAQLVAPLGEVLTVRGKGKKETLVRARRSFIDQLVRAVEELGGRVP